MNEKIRELAHEAGLPTYNPEGIPTKLEKFAEQIVQECVRYLCEDYSRNFDVPWRADLSRGIYNHFGVER